jgi:hypothetical protein
MLVRAPEPSCGLWPRPLDHNERPFFSEGRGTVHPATATSPATRCGVSEFLDRGLRRRSLRGPQVPPVAHQYVDQLEEGIRDAVFGNAGTMITFRVGNRDAELLAREFAPVFAASDMSSLGKYRIYLRLMIDGVASRPFTGTTTP